MAIDFETLFVNVALEDVKIVEAKTITVKINGNDVLYSTAINNIKINNGIMQFYVALSPAVMASVGDEYSVTVKLDDETLVNKVFSKTVK